MCIRRITSNKITTEIKLILEYTIINGLMLKTYSTLSFQYF